MRAPIDDAGRNRVGNCRSLRLAGRPAAGYVTGEVLHVAGGSQIWGDTWTGGRPAWFDEP